MSLQLITYFGYGSLVNRDTRPKDEHAINACLTGWQRVWEHRVVADSGRSGCTSLSVEPVHGAQIDGVLVSMPIDRLPVLDQRESGYKRMEVPASAFTTTEPLGTDTVYVYRSLSTNRCMASHEHPILQSYIDVVMAGYESRFGEQGLLNMLDSTAGWNTPIFNDRERPRYPRSLPLGSQKASRYEQLLEPYRQ